MSQVVKCLPSKCKALNLNPNTAKKRGWVHEKTCAIQLSWEVKLTKQTPTMDNYTHRGYLSQLRVQVTTVL
jgi:hypothetical protein